MIDSITMTILDTNNVRLAFSVIDENDLIVSVSLGLAVDSHAYSTYIDETGLRRSQIFNLSNLGMTLLPASVINGIIGIKDADGNYRTYKAVEYASRLSRLPVLDNVRGSQRLDGSGLVDIFYDYLSGTEVSPATVSLSLSSNGGVSFGVPITSALGDFGSGVGCGLSRRIVWDPKVDIPGVHLSTIVAKISLVDEMGNVATGSTGIFSIDEKYYGVGPFVVFKNPNEGAPYGRYDGDNVKDRSKEIVIVESSSSSYSSSNSSSSSS